MKPILKALVALLYVVGCYELFSIALRLLTYPSDITFTIGLAVMLVLLIGNVELVAHYFNVFTHKLKGTNESEKVDVSASTGSSSVGGLH